MNINNPIIIAHRGLARYAPENTLAAYAAALELGFGLEIDLRLTADKKIAMIHDQTLNRTTNGQGPVSQKNLAEIRCLDAGSWFNSSFRDQRVPTLGETLKLIHKRRVPTVIALDVKAEVSPIEVDICTQVEHYKLFDQVVGIGGLLSSTEFRHRFKAVDTRFSTAIGIDTPAEWEAALSDDSADWIYFRFIPSEAQIADARRAGKRVLSSGPVVMQHQPENWLRMRELGIDTVLTDYPLECRRCWQISQ